ncbi:hypothetical protein MKEN_00522600 [Mycena kentingensis (nom. inval.)]|nr:hypothetical protein MKEN_00522600 [Mycena kentingensis (nom. inval.)]
MRRASEPLTRTAPPQPRRRSLPAQKKPPFVVPLYYSPPRQSLVKPPIPRSATRVNCKPPPPEKSTEPVALRPRPRPEKPGPPTRIPSYKPPSTPRLVIPGLSRIRYTPLSSRYPSLASFTFPIVVPRSPTPTTRIVRTVTVDFRKAAARAKDASIDRPIEVSVPPENARVQGDVVDSERPKTCSIIDAAAVPEILPSVETDPAGGADTADTGTSQSGAVSSEHVATPEATPSTELEAQVDMPGAFPSFPLVSSVSSDASPTELDKKLARQRDLISENGQRLRGPLAPIQLNVAAAPSPDTVQSLDGDAQTTATWTRAPRAEVVESVFGPRRVRKVIVPPIFEGAVPSRNPTIVAELVNLRAQKKVGQKCGKENA